MSYIEKFGPSLRRAALGLLLAGGCGAVAQAATVNVSAVPTSVTLGSKVSVFFDVSQLAADALSLFSFEIHYDSAVLGLSGFSFVDPLSLRNELDLPDPASLGFAGDVSAQPGGILDVFGLSGNAAAVLDSDQADAFRFLTLTFDTLAVATATTVDLQIATSLFGDSMGNALNVGFNATQAQIEITSAGQPVPEPGALALSLLALLASAAVSSRRRLAAALAGTCCLLSGVAWSQQPPPQAAQATTPAVMAIDAVVVKVQGMRVQLRGADGREFWISTRSQVDPAMVGKRLTGQAVPRGDTLVVSSPAYAAAP
ncbi:MAG: hypothetical protein KGN16_04960 [Burkholderiales bacterium]|nr:hypothetical protein [Burkholderiales bacterium]